MNAPTRIAQVTGAAGSKPVRILKIEKPQGGQAVTAEASYDGTVTIDFTAIANEKITLVHIGERLIILFDNQSTVTIVPFFDSMGVPLANITIESNGKEFSGAEFASTFPITTDQSVLPAAGDGAGTPASGANFSNASVDPLLGPDPVPLLGPEDLPPIQFTRIEGPITAQDLLPSTSENDPVLIDEDDISSAFSQGIGNTDSSGDDNPINVSGVLKFFAGDPPTTVDFASMHLDPVEGKDSQGNTGPLTSQGHDLVYVWFGDTLKAVWASDESHVVFQIEVNPATGAYTLTLFDQLDHPYTNDPSTPADDATVLGFEDNLIVDLIYTVTDSDGQIATGTLTVDFDDDMPRVTGAVESRIVDEDDIDTPWSLGTSPNDGDADGSITENSTGAAFVSGTLANLVDIGADEVPLEIREQPPSEDNPAAIIGSGIIFSFTADVIAQMEALGLYSKQSVQPATENGLALTYTIGTSGDWQVLSAFEPDTSGPGNTGNPVFELRVNQFTGEYEFRLFDELIHQLPPGFPNGSDENFGLRSGEPDPVTGQAIVTGLDFGSIIQVTDYDGDSVTLDGKFQIQIRDDVPEPDIDASRDESVIHDETPGDDGADDESFNSLPGSARTAFTGVTNTANDPDVPSTNLGAIGFAHDDDAIAFIDFGDTELGADHPPASQVFSLAIVGGNGTDSGLDITEGNSILLFLENGVIVGRVSGGPFDGQAAFAVHINQDGEFSLAQWLSIKHDDRGDFDESNDNGNNANDASPDDPLTIQQTLNGKINAVLTITDSDGDSVSDAVGIGDRVIFQDDGPSFTKLEADDDLTHDETPGLQDDDVDVSNVPAAALAALATVANPGDDPHVPPATGPIGYAVSTGSILDVAVNYGSDGQGAPIAYELVLDNNNIHSGLTTTDGRDIHLFKEGNVVVGRYEIGGNNVPDGSADEPAAFAIYIDPATGQTTMVQYVSLFHPDDNDSDEEVDIDSDVLFVKVTVVDGDGDALTEYVDIGSKIEFDDDAPTATFTLNSGVSIIHDETVGVDGDANDVATNLSSLFGAVSNKGNDPHESTAPEPEIGYAQSIGSLVTVSNVNFGADGPGPNGGISYSLDIPGSSIASGLFTTEGLPITLFQVNSQVIVGRFDGPDGGTGVGTGDPAAFAIHVDPTTGVVTVVQYVSIRHDDINDHDEANDDGSPGNDASPVNDAAVQQWINNNALQIIATVTDGDGDELDSQAFNIGNKIVFQDDGPTGTNSIAQYTVSGQVISDMLDDEDQSPAFPLGSDGIDGGPGDDGIGTTAVGDVNVNFGVDGPAATNSLVVAGPAGLSVVVVDAEGNGSPEAISYVWQPAGGGGGTLLGVSASFPVGDPAFKLVIDADGDYTFSAFAPLSHPLTDDPSTSGTVETEFEDNLNLQFTYTATDGDGDFVTGAISVNVDDDTPDPVCDQFEVTEGGQGTVNIILVLDRSGSMATDDVDGFSSRLALAKSAAINLLNSANVNQVMTVQFDSGSAINDEGGNVWTSKTDAINYIAGLTTGSGTNYDSPLSLVQSNWGSGPTSATKTLVFFISDGEPNEPSGSAGVSAGEETTWYNFLASKGVSDAYAIGIGTGVNGADENQLEPVAWHPGEASATNPTAATDNNVVVISNNDLADLIGTLVGLLPGVVSGNVLANDGFGADGLDGITSITVDGVVYTYNETTNQITSVNGVVAGSTLDVDTSIDGHLTFHFADGGGFNAGDFSYQSPATGVPSAGLDETFTYTIVDGDGDGQSAHLKIHVKDNPAPQTSSATAQVDDEGITPFGIIGDGSSFGDVDLPDPENVFNGNLNPNFNGDTPAAIDPISFADMVGPGSVNGEAVTYAWDSATSTLSATSVRGLLFTIQVDNGVDNGTGNFKFTLVKPLLHTAGGGENDITLPLTYRTTDDDGQFALNTLTVTIDDDTPTMSATGSVTAQVDEDELGGDAGDLSTGITDFDGQTDEATITTASLLPLVNSGADNPATIALNASISGNVKTDLGANVTLKGFAVKYAFSGGQVLGYADENGDNILNGTDRVVFRISASGGNYLFDLEDQLDHSLGINGTDTETMTLDITGAFAATDADGDTLILSGNRVQVVVENDIPSVTATTSGGAIVTHDESGGLQNAGANTANVEDNNDNDVAGNTLVTFNGVPNTSIASLFNGLTPTIDDPDVSSDAASTNSAIGYARGGSASVLASFTTGADEPITIGYQFNVLSNLASGLVTTDGKPIHFFLQDSTTVVGRYDGADAGTTVEATDPIAVAFKIDPLTGVVYVAQWVSLDHPTEAIGTGQPSYDEAVTFVAGRLAVEAVATDADGDIVKSAPADLSNRIFFEDSGPALDIVNSPSSVNELQTINGTRTLAEGSDGVDSVVVTVGANSQTLQLTPSTNVAVFFLAEGTLTVDADLQWHFSANAVAASTSVTFSIKATDGDGDVAADSQTIQIINTNNPLVQTANFTGIVEEEHLNSAQAVGIDDLTSTPDGDNNPATPDGDDDVVGNLNVTTTVTTGNLSGMVTGIDGTATYGFQVTDGSNATFVGGGNIQSHGQNVLLDVQGNTLWGFVNVNDAGTTFDADDRAVFKLDLTPSTGAFTFTLLDNIDHHASGDQVEGIRVLDLSNKLTVSDSADGGTLVFNNVAINIIDDIPVATPDLASAEEQGTVNLMLIIDVSGSMGDDPGVPGFATRLDLAKAALEDLLNSANVNEVLIVTFSTNAQSLGWFDNVQDAIDAINALDDGGTTNYDEALTDAMTAYNLDPPSTADATVALFLSDGAPNEPGGDEGIDLTEQAAWETFLTTNGITSFAVGVGNGVNVSNLQPIAFPNGDPDNPVVVTNEGDLSETLTSLVSSATGNVLTDGVLDDAFGADGGRILSIDVNGTLYTWNGASTVSTSGDSAPVGTVLGTNSFTTTTDNGGTFTFNFATGAWQYGAPTEVTAVMPDEVFNYTIRDNDGDTAAATLTIDLIPVNDAPVISLNGPNTEYLDEFNTTAYNNSDGATNWAPAPWTESSDNNSAASGAIRVAGSELRFGEDGGNGATIQRTVNLAGATSATLTFDFEAVESESGESVVVSFAADGVTFVTLDTLDTDDANGLKIYNLTGPFTANAAIRFSVNAFSNDSEWVAIDNVSVVGSFVPTYAEGGAVVDILDTATIADPDLPTNFNGGSLHVQLTAGAVAGDQLTFTAGATQSAGNVLVGATNVGTVTGYGTPNMTINFNANATDGLIETLMHSIGFSSISDNPGTSRTATVTFNDGGNTGSGGPKSDVTTVNINVVATNDAPVITAPNGGNPESVSVAENTTAVTDINATDPDSGATLTYSIVNTAGTDFSKFTINSSSGVLTFAAAPNFEAPTDTGGTDGDNIYVVDVQVSDGLGGIDTQTISVTVTSANEVIAVNDIVRTNFDGVAFSVPEWAFLFNDADPEGNPLDISGVSNSDDLSATHAAGSGTNGTVNIDDDNSGDGGDFDYTATDGSASDTANVQVFNLNGGGNVTGTASNEILVGDGNGNTFNGAGGVDIIFTGAGTDTIVADQADHVIDGGADTDTLQVGANFNDANNAQIVGIENVTLTAAGLTLNLGDQTEGFTINGSSGADFITAGSGSDIVNSNGGADTINTGTGADVVNISAGTTATALAVNLGSDAAIDKVVFTHASLGTGHDTVATVSNFTAANDRIAVTLNGTAIADGAFQTVTTTQTNISAGVEVVELVSASWVGSLTADGDSGTIEGFIAAATNGIANGNYTFIVYSDATGTANAGIYSVNISDNTDPTTGGDIVVEHIMTLNGVGFGNLGDANFVATADPLVLDLGAPGLDFTGVQDGVSFDINADGRADRMAWTAGEDGILAMDLDSSGTIDSGAEVFSPWFAGGEHAGSLAALATLDENGDGRIDADDAAYGSLQIWQDANHNGVSDAGELTGLAALGITGINLGAAPVNGSVDGQQLLAAGTFNYADGSTGSFAEVDFDAEFGRPRHSEPAAGHVGQGEIYLIGANQPPITIEGFAEGDSLDLSELLDTNFAAGDNVDDFIRLQESGGDITVQVDTSGPSGGANFVDVVTLAGYGTSNADIVRAVFSGQEQQLAS